MYSHETFFLQDMETLKIFEFEFRIFEFRIIALTYQYCLTVLDH